MGRRPPRRTVEMGLPARAGGLPLSGVCLLIASCFRPDLGAAHYACDPALLGSDCPPGFRCHVRMCERPPDGAPSGPDLPATAVDLRGPGADLGPPDDLAGPDGLMSAPACAHAGQALTAGVHACSGTFAAGGYAAVCADRHHPCVEADRTALSAVPAATCRGLNGFFASRLNAGYGTMSFVPRCPFTAGDQRALIGCGAEADAHAVSQSDNCARLTDAVPCVSGKDWTCSTGLDNATHTGLTGGVLCCKD